MILLPLKLRVLTLVLISNDLHSQKIHTYCIVTQVLWSIRSNNLPKIILITTFSRSGSWMLRVWTLRGLSGSQARSPSTQPGTSGSTSRWEHFLGSFLFNAFPQGKASNGGFAIDQLTFYPGECPSKWILEEFFRKFVLIEYSLDRPENTRNVPRNWNTWIGRLKAG